MFPVPQKSRACIAMRFEMTCIMTCAIAILFGVRIHKNLEKKGDTERLQLFSQLQRALKEGNHLSTSTIDELLNRPMQQKSRDTNPPLAMFRVGSTSLNVIIIFIYFDVDKDI